MGDILLWSVMKNLRYRQRARRRLWHNKFGARIVVPSYTNSCGGIPKGFISEEEFVQNRTQEKRENVANDKESDSIGEAP